MIEEWQHDEILRQIGRGNVLAVSGGLVLRTRDGVVLLCGNGYSVEVALDPTDTYTVRRVFSRSGKRFVKGEVSDVYCTELAETVYRAGMFRDPWPESDYRHRCEDCGRPIPAPTHCVPCVEQRRSRADRIGPLL